ncbi:Protein bric-a-brac 2 [Habropoda laboriosa]|uniref:Protein bric-a-brac 2 n=1 Tax=Habropoda laboriosa TaxID=597456 RepID=A0A0L7RB50_9HYME|nr:Protein bric-a-brac 2 [Habropoda laboriosa]
MAGQHYCLRWNNYQSNMTSVFHQLLQTESFVDVTLACNEASLKAHKVVLSACSSYFQKLLLSNPCKHPTIIMPQDVCFNDLKFIIEFVYKGEIDVSQAELQNWLWVPGDMLQGMHIYFNQSQSNIGDAKGKGCDRDYIVDKEIVVIIFVCLEAAGKGIRRVAAERTKSLLKTADQLKIKGLCEVPESRDGPPSVSLSSPPREPGTPRINFTKLKRHHPRYKRARTTFEPRATDSRHYDRYKEEESNEDYNLENKENHRDWQPEDEECTEATTGPVVLETWQRNANSTGIATTTATTTTTTTTTTTATSNNSNNNSSGNSNGDMFCHTGLGHYGHHPDPGEVDLPPETQPTPPSATLVGTTITHLRDPDHHSTEIQNCDSVKIKFETLHTMDSSDTIDIDSHMSDRASVSSKNAADSDNMMMITPELLGLMPSGSSIHSDSGENNSRGHSGQSSSHHHGSKSWTQEDMDAALEALRNHDMSLTKASATFGIPSTTLWQRAHRLGIDTPKKDGPTKSWSDESLNNALEALRTGTISANKASKAFGIPSSTLYKIARREGIRLAAPFNASPTTWSPADLDRALEAIRSGQTSVQRASTEFGIPTGTLYGRCKREGIELSRSNPTPWSEDAMTEALEAVRLGHMSINQAAIHYNLPYSSLYGRFKRGKYEEPAVGDLSQDGSSPHFHQSPSQNHSSAVPDQMPYQGS